MVECAGGKVVCALVPECWIKLYVRSFGLVLFLDFFLRNGIQDAAAGDSNCAFQAEAYLVAPSPCCLVRCRLCVESVLRDVEFGIYQLICLAIGKPQGKSAFHC